MGAQDGKGLAAFHPKWVDTLIQDGNASRNWIISRDAEGVKCQSERVQMTNFAEAAHRRHGISSARAQRLHDCLWERSKRAQ